MLVFRSARSEGRNVAIFEDSVFASEPRQQRLWISQVRKDRVMFRGKEGFFQFSVNDYFDESGNFPRVAA